MKTTNGGVVSWFEVRPLDAAHVEQVIGGAPESSNSLGPGLVFAAFFWSSILVDSRW